MAKRIHPERQIFIILYHNSVENVEWLDTYAFRGRRFYLYNAKNRRKVIDINVRKEKKGKFFE